MEVNSKTESHQVKLLFGNKHNFFSIKSGNSGEEYTVIMKWSCTCEYYSIEGAKNNGMCSHIMAALKNVVDNGWKNQR